MRGLTSVCIGLVFAASALPLAAQSPDTAPQQGTEQSQARAPAPASPACENPDAIGLAKTLEIDTAGGPGFGLAQYKVHDFLQPKEIVLTFDDGPQITTTKKILDTLDEHCTKAIFFSIGKMALGMPNILRDVEARGHTVGTHTWSHADLRKKKEKDGIDEIERGISGVHRALGKPAAPFFRFPYLRDSKAMAAHLEKRNIAMFSMDVDSFDFKYRSAKSMVKSVVKKLNDKGKGILLMHDIQRTTAAALPDLLAELKANGFKIVHLKAKSPGTSLPEYDAKIEKNVKGLPTAGNEKPTSSIVKVVPNAP